MASIYTRYSKEHRKGKRLGMGRYTEELVFSESRTTNSFNNNYENSALITPHIAEYILK
jgi:hypothetical protein